MSSVNIPDDIINYFVAPVAEALGVKHKRLSPTKIFINVLTELTKRLEKMDKKTLQPILEHLKLVIGPLRTIAEMGQVILSPIFAFIPPQYAIIFIAILLIPTVVIPSLFLGGTVQYYLEQWLKVPFYRSQREIDNVPVALQETMLTINSKERNPITIQLKQWLDIPKNQRPAYFYEADSYLQSKLHALNKFQVVNPTVTSETIKPWMITTFPRFYPDLTLPDFEEKVTLTRTMYRGWRKVLPPILTRTVEVVGSLFKKVSENALTDFAEHPWRTIVKYLTIGWLGFLG